MVVEDYYNKGLNAYNSGKYEDAKASLEKVVALNDAHADAQYYLARTFENLEDVENAKKHYQKVVELLPETTKRAQTAKTYLDTH